MTRLNRMQIVRQLGNMPALQAARRLRAMPLRRAAQMLRMMRRRQPLPGGAIIAAHTGGRVFTHPKQPFGVGAGLAQFDPVASPAILSGSTAHFHVYHAQVLGQPGDKIAQGVLKNCEHDFQALSGIFGIQQPLQFNVLVAPLSQATDGTGGAFHHSCIASDLYCDVQLVPEANADVTSALVVAEEVEVFEAIQNKGWNCGHSNGEGLSRVLAEELYPNVLESLGYSTASTWLNSARPNYVGRTLPTDRNSVANGCAVLFLNYLHTQLGFGWDKISQAASPTLAGTYALLAGQKAPFREFAALLQKKFPAGTPVALQADNPFPINGATPAAAASGAGGSKPGLSPKSK